MSVLPAETDWDKFQIDLSSKRIEYDDLPFDSGFKDLKYVGGCDVSFVKDDQSVGVATIVILKYPSLKLIYSKSKKIKVDVPYKSGYLSFREYPAILELLNEIKMENNEIYPQIMLVDGNGIFHPRKCGLACSIGILGNIPSIGIGKNFLVISEQDLTIEWKKLNTSFLKPGESIDIVGRNGGIYGSVYRSGTNTKNPIYTSPGNRISVKTSLELVKTICKYRIPEPIRMADRISREQLAFI
jgi:deoxyinosine 3'endonuclease (endonuclease V)